MFTSKGITLIYKCLDYFSESTDLDEKEDSQITRPAICLTKNDSVGSNRSDNHNNDGEVVLSESSEVKQNGSINENGSCERTVGYR